MPVNYSKRCSYTVSALITINIDCEQSLSFPSVFRAIERTSRGSSSGEWWAANREKRGRGEKEKERDCGGIFDLFDLPPLTPVWLMVPPSLQTDTISRPSHYCEQLEFSLAYVGLFVFISFYADTKQSALEIRTSSRLLHEIHKPSTYREMWANFLRDKL